MSAESDNSKGLYIDLGVNEEESSPDLFVPLRWNDNLYSGFGFRSNSDRIEELNIPGFVSSERNFYISDERYKFNIVTYEKKFNEAVVIYGIEYESINILEEEYGYEENIGPIFVTYEDVERFDISKLSLKLGFQIKMTKWVQLKSELIYTPSPEIDYSNERYAIFNNTFVEGEHFKSYPQDHSYQINLVAKFNVSRYFDLTLAFDYEKLPINFEEQLYSSGSYILNSVSYNRVIERSALRFIFKKSLFESVKPVIGLKNEKIYKNSVEISDNNLVFIGIENRF